VIVVGEKRGAGKRQGGAAVPIEHGVDLLGGWGVGDGHHVIADLRDSYGAAV